MNINSSNWERLYLHATIEIFPASHKVRSLLKFFPPLLRIKISFHFQSVSCIIHPTPHLPFFFWWGHLSRVQGEKWTGNWILRLLLAIAGVRNSKISDSNQVMLMGDASWAWTHHHYKLKESFPKAEPSKHGQIQSRQQCRYCRYQVSKALSSSWDWGRGWHSCAFCPLFCLLLLLLTPLPFPAKNG